MELQEKSLGIGVTFVMTIIDRDTFEKAKVERIKRTTALGRIWDKKETKEDINILIVFKVGIVDQKYKNLLKQAENILKALVWTKFKKDLKEMRYYLLGQKDNFLEVLSNNIEMVINEQDISTVAEIEKKLEELEELEELEKQLLIRANLKED